MRTIKKSSQFKKDLKRERKGKHSSNLAGILEATLKLLVNDQALPVAFRDHALTGNTLELLRLGSHSELGL
jgi:mRNA interferase YafQ